MVAGASQDLAEAWPARVWVGVSVETQKYAPRLQVLARLPVPIQFVSAEPLLGPLDLTLWLESLAWVIVGGESGMQARPMDLDWVRILRDQSLSQAVPFFLKQLGRRRDKRTGWMAVDGNKFLS